MSASSPRSKSPGLSPMSTTSPRKAFTFSAGHGAYHKTQGLRTGKTEIRPDAVESVEENARHAVSGGTVKLKSEQIDVHFVPRRSDPSKYRAIGVKQISGTAFPFNPSNIPGDAFTTSGISASDVVNEPHSPRLPKK